MTAVDFGWTEALAVAGLRADPSGVLDASTVVQALLFPGMSTQTQRVRYLSLFAAARYYRMLAGESAEKSLPLETYLRRFEALIAVGSIRHHRVDQLVPGGIVGRNAAQHLSQQQEVALQLGIVQPPYRIYIGTMANLQVLDSSQPSAPLFETAKQLAAAWELPMAGDLGQSIQRGLLPETVSREEVDAVAGAFCLCGVPHNSSEQTELIRRLMLVPANDPSAMLSAEEKARSVAWRFTLELIRRSIGEPLASHLTMIRLLRPDLIADVQHPALVACLYAWRWVAARTFFERGWTQLFAMTHTTIAGSVDGLSRDALRDAMRSRYLREHQDEPLSAIIREAEANWESPAWLTAHFESRTPRDLLLKLFGGLMSASRDRACMSDERLDDLWNREDISFRHEFDRLTSFLTDEASAATTWAILAEDTLIQHVHIALRKMSAGNPDSLLVDFDNGYWQVPGKAQGVRLFPADGFSRLDIALSWAAQLGLIAPLSKGYTLTALGNEMVRQWDEARQ